MSLWQLLHFLAQPAAGHVDHTRTAKAPLGEPNAFGEKAKRPRPVLHELREPLHDHRPRRHVKDFEPDVPRNLWPCWQRRVVRPRVPRVQPDRDQNAQGGQPLTRLDAAIKRRRQPGIHAGLQIHGIATGRVCRQRTQHLTADMAVTQRPPGQMRHERRRATQAPVHQRPPMVRAPRMKAQPPALACEAAIGEALHAIREGVVSAPGLFESHGIDPRRDGRRCVILTADRIE